MMSVKSKNIHVLPTDKPSNLYVLGKELKLRYVKDLPIDSDIVVNQNIYITSDEEIKEGDWCYNIDADIWAKCKIPLGYKDWKKIILTTDQDLIDDGVQAIDDEFLEWFVKNPSCECVEVKNGAKRLNSDGEEIGFPDMSLYKIIIPKEEDKQETLEEVAERLYSGVYRQFERMLFIEGAKWQQEQDKNKYSEDDIREAFRQGQENMNFSEIYGWSSNLTEEEWFKQFKNK